jgi:hypothetical protein
VRIIAQPPTAADGGIAVLSSVVALALLSGGAAPAAERERYAEEGASIRIKGLQADGGTARVWCRVVQALRSGGASPAAEPGVRQRLRWDFE